MYVSDLCEESTLENVPTLLAVYIFLFCIIKSPIMSHYNLPEYFKTRHFAFQLRWNGSTD